MKKSDKGMIGRWGKWRGNFFIVYMGERVKLGYSVMQSDGNIFSGDVVLYSFNKASRDENNISQPNIEKANMFGIFSR